MTPRRRSLEARLSTWAGPQARMDPSIVEAELRGETVGSTRGMSNGNPTLRELEVLLAVVDHGTNERAAEALGITRQTVKNHLTSLMERVKANHRTHLVWRLWPVISDAWPGPAQTPRQVNGRDRRAGYERRRSGRNAT